MWTQFWDMHSGGGSKEKWTQIFIEASEDEARIIFYNRFNHNPDRVSCTCCGSDYSISEYESLEQATAFHRGCRYAYMKGGKEISQSERWKVGDGIQESVWAGYIEEQGDWREYKTLEEFEKEDYVLIIRKNEISQDDKTGSIPEQGYVWVD